MKWIDEHRRMWGGVLLALLLLAIAGPWTFDRVNVPAEYPCDYRLEGDYCGIPMSGMWILAAFAGSFVSLVPDWVAGLAARSVDATDVGRFLLFSLLVIIFLLPVVSALLHVLARDRRQGLHAAAWGLAVLASLWLILFVPELTHRQLWGLWLYFGLAPVGLVLETAALVGRGKPQRH